MNHGRGPPGYGSQTSMGCGFEPPAFVIIVSIIIISVVIVISVVAVLLSVLPSPPSLFLSQPNQSRQMATHL